MWGARRSGWRGCEPRRAAGRPAVRRPLRPSVRRRGPGALPGERAASGPLAACGAAISFQGVTRTRFFDDYLLAAWQAGCRRVLVTKGVVPRCERTVVAVDLREDWPAELTRVSLEPAEPTAWLAEGLLIYLSAAQAARLLAAVGQLSAPGSQLAFEHGTPAGARLLDQARASQAKSLRYSWVAIGAAIRTACSAVQ